MNEQIVREEKYLKTMKLPCESFILMQVFSNTYESIFCLKLKTIFVLFWLRHLIFFFFQVEEKPLFFFFSKIKSWKFISCRLKSFPSFYISEYSQPVFRRVWNILFFFSVHFLKLKRFAEFSSKCQQIFQQFKSSLLQVDTAQKFNHLFHLLLPLVILEMHGYDSDIEQVCVCGYSVKAFN